MDRSSREVLDIVGIDLLNREAWELRVSDPHRALEVAGRALEASELADHEAGRAWAHLAIGYARYRMAEFEVAEEHASRAHELFEGLGDVSGRAQAQNTTGNIRSALGDHHGAFEAYMSTLKTIDESQDRRLVAATWNNVGNVHFSLGDYASALEAHARSKEIKERSGDRNGVATSLLNIGNVHKHMGEFDKAIEYYGMALSIMQQIGNKFGLAAVYGNVGSIHAETGKPIEGRDNLLHSLTLEKETGNRLGEAEAYIQLGELFLQNPDLIDSSDDPIAFYLKQALDLASELKATGILVRVHRALSELAERRSDRLKALEHFKRFHELEREVFNEELSEKTRKLQIIHQVERSKKEAELRRFEVEMTRLRNEELALALREAERQRTLAEEANAFKTKLLSIAAHDLRNPLNGISGFSNLLLEGLPEDSPHIEPLNQVLVSSQQMERLIEDLLESSAIETGKINLHVEQVNLSVLAERVMDSNVTKAIDKGQQLLLEAGARCIAEADELRMWQIFDNLVSNAIKFSPLRRRIWIKTERQAETVQCSVRDEGPGFTESDKQRIFGRFERLSARPTAGEPTTGLGLSIVKQLVELQGGRIRAESPGPGHGSTFTFEFPVRYTDPGTTGRDTHS